MMAIYSTRRALVRAFLATQPARFGRVLYVGASLTRKKPPCMLRDLRKRSSHIDCLEIYEPNIAPIRAKGWFQEVRLGDVRDLRLEPGDYDLVVWWHGPEHVPHQDAIRVMGYLRSNASNVWIGAPWGEQPQNPRTCAVLEANPFQEHLCSVDQGMLEDLGFHVMACGACDSADYQSYLIGWSNKDAPRR